MPLTQIQYIPYYLRGEEYSYPIREALCLNQNSIPILSNVVGVAMSSTQFVVCSASALICGTAYILSNDRITLLRDLTDCSLRCATFGVYGLVDREANRPQNDIENPPPTIPSIRSELVYPNRLNTRETIRNLDIFLSSPHHYVDDSVTSAFLYEGNQALIPSSSNSIGAINFHNLDLIRFVKICFEINQKQQEEPVSLSAEINQRGILEGDINRNIEQQLTIFNSDGSKQETVDRIKENLKIFFDASKEYGKKIDNPKHSEGQSYLTFEELIQKSKEKIQLDTSRTSSSTPVFVFALPVQLRMMQPNSGSTLFQV